MSGPSVTGGWDAICALDSGALTQLLFQNYLAGGPLARSQALQIVVAVDEGAGTYALVDLMLGPPDLSFPASAGLQQAYLSRFVLGGWYVLFDAQSLTILTATPQQEATLSGTLNLNQVTGSQGPVGQLVVDLGSGAWTPALLGLDPGSETSAAIGLAIATFYQEQSTSYPLGTVATGSGVPAGLQPQAFDFVTAQQGDATGPSCVQLLIRTTGSGGPVQPLASYPIPAGSTAALILSNEILFGSALPAALNAGVFGQTIGATATGQQGSDGEETQVAGGSVDIGILGTPGSNTIYYTSQALQGGSVIPPAGAPVGLPLAGTFTLGSNAIAFAWAADWSQTWAYADNTMSSAAGLQSLWYTTDVDMSVSMSWTGTPTVVAGSTNLITFTASSAPAPTVSGSGSRWDKIWDSAFISQFEQNSAQPLQAAFGTFPFPNLSTFSLDNLLFPSQPGFALQFDQVSLPFDLVITGQLPPALTVTASPLYLPPGQTYQLSATYNGASASVTWETQAGSLGTVDATGLYTAPASVTGTSVDVVVATLDGDSFISGGVLIFVAAVASPTALEVSPPAVTLTQGQYLVLTVTESGGALVDGPPPSIPGGLGTIAPTAFQPAGTWTYTAPAAVATAATVSLTFASDADPSETGTAVITLAVSATVTVNASSSSVTSGEQVQLQASSETLEYFEWLLTPPGCGTLAGEGASATYTAPGTVTSTTPVTIVAYAITGTTAGIGTTEITLDP